MDTEIKREKYKEALADHNSDQEQARNGVMGHVVKCGSCEYTTNMIGDLTAHRKAYHPRQKGRV